MKTIQNLGVVLLAVGLATSCKKMEEISNDDSATEAVVQSITESGKSKTDSLLGKSPKSFHRNRKFIRTADIKFKVNNVSKSTYAIENGISKFGGFVINTDLQTNVINNDEVKISQDSSVVTTKYVVENNITIRVPNAKLDTVIKIIAKQIDFLDHRIIKSDDVSLQILSNELAQNRGNNLEIRLAAAIDKKGKKLNDIVTAEDNLANKKEENDFSQLENLSLNDQINFSTLTLNVYQRKLLSKKKLQMRLSCIKILVHKLLIVCLLVGIF